MKKMSKQELCLCIHAVCAIIVLTVILVDSLVNIINGGSSTAEQATEANAMTECSEITENAAQKQQEIIATEAQITTEKATESATEAAKTDKKSESVGKMVFNSERKTAERTAVTTEETTGEINEDGYGWVQLQYSAEYHIREDHLTRSNGVVYAFGHKETWYSTNEACGQTTAKEIPGKHVADDGTIRDEDGYICVASSDLKFYEIVMTTVGPGKVYDCGCSSGTIDVYTTW